MIRGYNQQRGFYIKPLMHHEFKNNGNLICISISDVWRYEKDKCKKNDNMYSLTIVLESSMKDVFIEYVSEEELILFEESVRLWPDMLSDKLFSEMIW